MKFFIPATPGFALAQSTLDNYRELSSTSGVQFLHVDAITGVNATGSLINSLQNQAPYLTEVSVAQTGTSRPTLNATGNFKGGPSFDFAAASSQWFDLTNYGLKMTTGRPGFTFYIAHKPTITASNQSVFWTSLGAGTSATNNPRVHFGIIGTSGDRFLQFEGQDAGTYNYKQWASPITSGNPVVDIIRIDAVSGKFWAYQGYESFPIVNQFTGQDSLSGTGAFSNTDSLSCRLGYDNQSAGYYNGSQTVVMAFAAGHTAQEIAFVLRKGILPYYPASTRKTRQIIVTGDSNAWGLKVSTDSARLHNQIVNNLTALSGGRIFTKVNAGWGGIPAIEQSWLSGNGFYYDVMGMPVPNLEKRAIVINQGGNDVLFGSPPADIVANAIRICREYKLQGADYVILNNIGPNTNSTTNTANVAANGALATSFADKANGLGRWCDVLVDMYSVIQPNMATYLDADGIHYNDAGMAKAGQTDAAALQSIPGWAA